MVLTSTVQRSKSFSRLKCFFYILDFYSDRKRSKRVYSLIDIRVAQIKLLTVIELLHLVSLLLRFRKSNPFVFFLSHSFHAVPSSFIVRLQHAGIASVSVREGRIRCQFPKGELARVPRTVIENVTYLFALRRRHNDVWCKLYWFFYH